jgi:hypothetical protein
MSEPRSAVRLTEREIRALLDLCPRCRECRARAEIIINKRALCVPCAGLVRVGKAESPPWADAADALECAISPHERSQT